MKDRILSLLLTLLIAVMPGSLSAQDKIRARGTVTDDTGEPLIGVAVRVRGTQNGAQTDIDGHFAIDCKPGDILDFSYIGFKSASAKSASREMIVTLEEDVKTMDQVVVNGYTQTDIRKATGSVGILTDKDLKDAPLANVDMLMQGKLAGVNVQAVSGRPGESAKVRIRGTSSITGNNEPLWVVDGVPLQKSIPNIGGSEMVRTGNFASLYANGVAGIPPQDIESITVLKDAAASAIYGSQAQAGVIVITTKKGKAGKLNLSYSGNVSVQTSPSRDHNLMNSEEKLAYEQSIWDEFSAANYALYKAGDTTKRFPVIGIIGQIRSGYGQFAGMTTAEQDAYIEQLKQTNTDWFQELFRNTVSTSHYLSASGGTDRLTYYVSGGINTNKGIVKKTSSDGYNFNAKIAARPTDAISMNFSASYNYLKSLSPGSNSTFDMFKYAYFANPYEKPYNEDGSYAADNTYYSLARANGNVSSTLPENGINVFREMDHTTMNGGSSSTTVQGDITWRINEHFRLYGLASYTYSNDSFDNEVEQDTYSAWLDRPFEGANTLSKRIYGSMTQTSNYNQGYILRAQADYNQTFNRIHHVRATAGAEIRDNYSKSIFRKVYGYDPVTGNFSLPLLVAGPSGNFSESDMQSYQSIMNSLSSQSRTQDRFASFYGTLGYVLKNRYIAEATVRSDGSNNFGAKEQFNLIWSTGLAWNIDEERFMKPLKDIISRATIRVSTGLTGGVNKSVYPVLIMNYSAEFRNSATQAYRMGSISSPPNPHLRWEHTRDWNGSLDLGFLKNRLNMNLSFYRREGYDLVTPVRTVSSTGYDSQSYNTTEQVNQGVELMLGGTPVKLKDWIWSLNGNISYNQNFLTKYESTTGSMQETSNYVGYPLGKIFSSYLTGIDPTTGLYTFQLRDDANLDEPYNYRNYLYYIGTSNYPWTGGISTSLTWKNLSISVSTSFSLGAKIPNVINASEANYGQAWGSTKNSIYNTRYDAYTAHLNTVKDAAYRWTVDNPVTDGYPRLIDAYGSVIKDTNGQQITKDQQVSSSMIQDGVFYENGSYWKIGAITLLYSLPSQLCKKMSLSNAGVSFTANNLWIITAYKGMNPETPGAVYPMSRSFSVGLNIGL